MSEPIPESIPTSADPRSKRPTKKRALTPASAQSAQVEALFAKPDREIKIPDSSAGKRTGLAPPPEIVSNVQGSSAGAGSGEFHVYKASRRREYERLRLMEDEVRQTKEDEDYQKAKEERERQDQEKTNKNKKRRDKQKQRKEKQKQGSRGDAVSVPDGTPQTNGSGTTETNGKGDPVANDPSSAEGQRTRADNPKDSGEATPHVAVPAEIGIVIHDDD